MSNQLILIPSTVKPHDVERNSLKQATPVPFIKPLDNQPVTKEHKVKISTSSDSTTAEYLYPFQGGTGEDYLLHRILLEDLINKMNLQDNYNGYEKEMKNVVDDLEEHDRSKPSEGEWSDVVVQLQLIQVHQQKILAPLLLLAVVRNPTIRIRRQLNNSFLIKLKERSGKHVVLPSRIDKGSSNLICIRY